MTEKKHQTIHMCDFCIHEEDKCGAERILSQQIALTNGTRLDSKQSVVACNIYESPVELLKTKIH